MREESPEWTAVPDPTRGPMLGAGGGGGRESRPSVIERTVLPVSPVGGGTPDVDAEPMHERLAERPGRRER